MKTIFNHLAALTMALTIATVGPYANAQQDPPDVGFVRIVPVLTAGTGKTHILIDGQDIYPIGYDVGQKTGGICLKAGLHSISLQKTGIRSAITSFNVRQGQTCSLIGYAEKELPKIPSDPPQWKTRFIPLKRSDLGSGYHLALISLCPRDEIRIQTEVPNLPKIPVAYLKRLVAMDVDLGRSKAEVSIKVNGERGTVISLEDPGNYTMVIYEDRADKLQSLWFQDPVFSPEG